MRLTSTIVTLIFIANILAACVLPPSKKRQSTSPPPTAEELALSQMSREVPLVNPPTPGLSLSELVSTPRKPVKEVNQVGELPKVIELSDKTLKNLSVELEDAETIQLDFEQITLRQLIELIGDALKLNMVIDPAIGEKVTIRTSKDKPLKKQDLWPLLQLLLTEAGISVEKKGGIYYFNKTGPSIPGTIGMSPESLTGSEEAEVLQVTPLRYISIESAAAVLTPLVQPKGRLLSLANVNVIGIITTPQRLERVNKLLEVIDADPFLHHGMRLFRLINSKVSEVQPQLDKIFQAISGRTPPAYQTVPLERVNAILVVAPPGGNFDDVATWVEILDERSEESGEQVFIYRVKNLEAAKLASTLSNVFKSEQQRQEDEILKQRQQQENQGQQFTPEGVPIPPPPQNLPGRLALGNTGMPVSAELKVNIVADESTNSLLIRANPRDYRQLLETIYALDQVPKEVMINVIIAEVTLTEATRFGIDWQAVFGEGRGSDGKQRSYAGINFNVPGKGTEENPLTGFVLNHVTGSLTAVLNLVASTNDISILSRPSLLVRNNEEASMNVGSNEPFLGSINTSSLNNQQVSQDVQYKDTGITVKVTPRINDDGIINMKIEQELSQVGPTRTTQNLQSFIQRKVTTSVVVRDNSAIIIGGLIQANRRNDLQGIPVLRDLPIVGNTLFSSTDKEDSRTELVLIMVPTIVQPELDNRGLVREFRRRMNLVSELLNEGFLVQDLVGTQPVLPKRK